MAVVQAKSRLQAHTIPTKGMRLKQACRFSALPGGGERQMGTSSSCALATKRPTPRLVCWLLG